MIIWSYLEETMNILGPYKKNTAQKLGDDRIITKLYTSPKPVLNITLKFVLSMW